MRKCPLCRSELSSDLAEPLIPPIPPIRRAPLIGRRLNYSPLIPVADRPQYVYYIIGFIGLFAVLGFVFGFVSFLQLQK